MSLKIFLSGGTHGEWQERVKAAFCGVEYFDPRHVSGQTMEEIALEERAWLDETDCVFFYFESTNPSGLGSAFEMGYARANDIPIVFVDEKKTQHTEWLGVHADVVVHTLDEGIAELRSTIASLASHD